MKGDFEIHYEIQQKYPKAKDWYGTRLPLFGIKVTLPITKEYTGKRVLWELQERIKDGTKFRLVAVTRTIVEVDK